MPSENVQIVDVGIDYLTATFQGRKDARQAANKAFDLLEEEMGRGNIRRPWGMSGYHGWASGPIQVGHNHDAVLVRLSSHQAKENWRWFGERATNISRIDYQVTTRTNDSPSRRLAKHWRQARRFKAARKTNAAVGAYFGDDSTPTVYLGRRISNRFGRIYDKEKESGQDEWQGCVRYEVEFKNESGSRMTTCLLGCEHLENEIAREVVSFFRDRGVAITGFLKGVGNYSCIRNTSDASRRLRWLQAQVKPSVQALLELGLLDQTLEALGLVEIMHGSVGQHGPTQLRALERKVA